MTPNIMIGDKIKGFLQGGVSALETSGLEMGALKIKDARDIENHDYGMLLDVRKPDEWQNEQINGAESIFIGYLPIRLPENKKADQITTYCGSGERATVAASYLQQQGFQNVAVFMGSMLAYKNRMQSA